MMKYPFELPFSEVQANLDGFVTAVFSCLESEFLIMPKGLGFIDYPIFEQGYEALKQATMGFTFLEPEWLLQKTFEAAIVILVLRTMLGFTPPDKPKHEVIACIAGRGFGVRREDMKKMLIATRGKVFTLRNLDRLIDCTGLRQYRTR